MRILTRGGLVYPYLSINTKQITLFLPHACAPSHTRSKGALVLIIFDNKHRTVAKGLYLLRSVTPTYLVPPFLCW